MAQVNPAPTGVTPADAHALIDAGYRVIPLRDNRKPAVSDWSGAAGVEREDIDRWFPRNCVGILTGALRSGQQFFVVDIDVPKQRDDGEWTPDGRIAWYELCAEHGWDPVKPKEAFAVVRSRRGGAHFYFMAPAGLKITNANDFPEGIDVRGEGGYVVAPPSEGYEWR